MPETPSDFETPEALADYQKGFNEGYQIAQHMPELAEQLSSLKTTSPHLSGLQDGRVQYQHERQVYKLPDWLKERLPKKDDLASEKKIDRDIEPER